MKREKKEKQERFVLTYQQGMQFGMVGVLVDTKTGVNYFWSDEGNRIMPLYDTDGRILIEMPHSAPDAPEF